MNDEESLAQFVDKLIEDAARPPSPPHAPPAPPPPPPAKSREQQIRDWLADPWGHSAPDDMTLEERIACLKRSHSPTRRWYAEQMEKRLKGNQ